MGTNDLSTLLDGHAPDGDLERGPLEYLQDAVYSCGGETHETSSQRGLAAYIRSHAYTEHQRQRSVAALLESKLARTPTGKMLAKVAMQSGRAEDILASVGYETLRTLHASGLLYPQIAADLGVNITDLMAFMRQHPTAAEDAKYDAELCADSLTHNLLENIDPTMPFDKSQVEILKIRATVQLELNKRLSGRWAKHSDNPEMTPGQARSLEINISTNGHSAAEVNRDDPIDGEFTAVKESDTPLGPQADGSFNWGGEGR